MVSRVSILEPIYLHYMVDDSLSYHDLIDNVLSVVPLDYDITWI
jgi:hypothetical protein